MTNFFPAVGFLMSLLPEDRRDFLTEVGEGKKLMNNMEVYKYFATRWSLPDIAEEGADAELAGARLAVAVAERVAAKYAAVKDPTLVKMPQDLHDELEAEAKNG